MTPLVYPGNRPDEQPHTQMPHVPLHTQPTIANYRQLSSLPILRTDKPMNGKAAKGIASLEYVFESSLPTGEVEMRERVIKEAEEWERQNREKRRLAL
jgi:chromatin structure-remodeling complex protein RSC7